MSTFHSILVATLAATLLTAPMAWAAGQEGHGGGAWTWGDCTTGATCRAEVLDLWNAEHGVWEADMIPVVAVEMRPEAPPELVARVDGLLEKAAEERGQQGGAWPGLNEWVRGGLARGIAKLIAFRGRFGRLTLTMALQAIHDSHNIYSGVELPFPGDTLAVEHPPGATPQGFAFYQDEKSYLKMNPALMVAFHEQASAAWFHEAVFKALRVVTQARDSLGAQKITGIDFSALPLSFVGSEVPTLEADPTSGGSYTDRGVHVEQDHYPMPMGSEVSTVFEPGAKLRFHVYIRHGQGAQLVFGWSDPHAKSLAAGSPRETFNAPKADSDTYFEVAIPSIEPGGKLTGDYFLGFTDYQMSGVAVELVDSRGDVVTSISKVECDGEPKDEDGSWRPCHSRFTLVFPLGQ